MDFHSVLYDSALRVITTSKQDIKDIKFVQMHFEWSNVKSVSLSVYICIAFSLYIHLYMSLLETTIIICIISLMRWMLECVSMNDDFLGWSLSQLS